MKSYEKPVILANEELAEGVYAASGAGSVSVSSVVLTASGNEWYPVNTYTVTVTNMGSEGTADWSVSIPVVSGTVKEVGTYSGWFAKVSYNGSSIVITPYGGEFAGGSSTEVQITVKYDGTPVKIEGEKAAL